MSQKAIIIGSEGQDGRLLYNDLIQLGYEVVGIGRLEVRSNCEIDLSPINILKKDALNKFIALFAPDEVYYLAAYHHSSEDMPQDNCNLFISSININLIGLVNVLEAIRLHSSTTRLYYASSSHIFKGSGVEYQDENTPINPTCIYGITKAAGMQICRYYRKEYSIYASVGIMYNHESTLRSEKFISRKIISSAVKIKHRMQEQLIIGDIDAVIDWGYAPDYVEAIRLSLAVANPDDYIIASGKPHTIQDFIQIAFDYIGLDYTLHVGTDPSIIKKKSIKLVGNNSKIHNATGWCPKTEFKEMIGKMIDEELLIYGKKQI